MRQSGTWHMVGYHKRSDPATMRGRAEIDRLEETGELGRMTYVRLLMPAGGWVAGGFDDLIRVDGPRPQMELDLPAGDMSEEVYGRYTGFVNYYIHQVNLLRHLLGEPYRVTCADPGGWLEAPEDTYGGEWTFHPDFDLGSASIPVLVVDVNGDGLNDLIVGQSHAYGLDWWEQRIEAGQRTWIKHPIDPFNSQYHDLQWVDIDADGDCELVTGKRYRAHNGRDPGGYDDIGIYYFKWNGESFSKQVIDCGTPVIASVCGILFGIADLNGNGWLDIVAPGKDGLHLFENLGTD